MLSFLWFLLCELSPGRYLVGGLEHEFYFAIQLGMSSSQLTFTHIFFRGVVLPPTRLLFTVLNHIITIIINHEINSILTTYQSSIYSINYIKYINYSRFTSGYSIVTIRGVVLPPTSVDLQSYDFLVKFSSELR